MKFESTWIRVKNEVGCPYCGAFKGEFCVSKLGREVTGRVHGQRAQTAIANRNTAALSGPIVNVVAAAIGEELSLGGDAKSAANAVLTMLTDENYRIVKDPGAR